MVPPFSGFPPFTWVLAFDEVDACALGLWSLSLGLVAPDKGPEPRRLRCGACTARPWFGLHSGQNGRPRSESVAILAHKSCLPGSVLDLSDRTFRARSLIFPIEPCGVRSRSGRAGIRTCTNSFYKRHCCAWPLQLQFVNTRFQSDFYISIRLRAVFHGCRLKSSAIIRQHRGIEHRMTVAL